MAGYIGKSQGVTQVDGYNRTEADDRYVNDPDAVITVSGGNVGFGTNFPSAKLEVNGDVKSNKFAFYNEGAGANFNYTGYARFANGATESMRIDSAGRVTMPYQPAFDVATTNIAAINTSIVFNVAYVNRGNHFNTSTGTFTAPVAGAYHFTYSTIKDAGSTNEIGRFVLAKNGVVMNGGRELRLDLGQEYGDNGSQVWIINMNAGDYVNIKVGSSSNSSNYGGVAYNGFTGYLIG